MYVMVWTSVVGYEVMPRKSKRVSAWYRRKSKPGIKARRRRMRRLARQVQGYLGELKYGDSTHTTAVNYSGTLQSLTDIGQGDTDTQRDGDALTLSSIQVKGHWVVGDTYNICRLIVFQWLKDDATAPTASDILLNVGNIYAPVSMYNHDNRFQYRILYDKTSVVDTNRPVSYFSFKIRRFPKRYIQFSAASLTGVNKVYALYISDSSAVTHPSIYYDTKALYKDS